MLRVVVRVHIILLKHILQLGLESTENGINQSVRIQRQPAFHLISRKAIVVEGHVVTRSGIQSLTTDGLNQIAELVRSTVLRSETALLVDFELHLFTGFRVTRHGQRIIQRNHFLVVRFLFLPIQRTDLICALEEHML